MDHVKDDYCQDEYKYTTIDSIKYRPTRSKLKSAKPLRILACGLSSFDKTGVEFRKEKTIIYAKESVHRLCSKARESMSFWISLTRQAVVRGPSLIPFGAFPSATHRHQVERPTGISRRTSGKRKRASWEDGRFCFDIAVLSSLRTC